MMKTILSIITLVALFCGFVHAAETGKHLFILSGQSNMVGVNPDLSFKPAVEAEFGAENVVVVKDAEGGQPIKRWYKKWEPIAGDDSAKTGSPSVVEEKAIGDLYDRLMKKVYSASEGKEFETVTFLWMQGERDARERYGEVYEKSLKGLIEQLSNDLNRADINVVIGRLSDCGLKNNRYPHWMMVREAQMKVAEDSARGAWVNTDDLNDDVLSKKGSPIQDALHYSEEGYKTFGQRLASESIELITAKSAPKVAEGKTTKKAKKKTMTKQLIDVSEGRPVVRLWPIEQVGGEVNRLKHDTSKDGKVRYKNVKDPHLVVFPVQSSKPAPAVVCCPGGGYQWLTLKPELIKWLNDCGVTVFMLKYTVPDDREAALRDVQRAMRLVRQSAKQWNIDPSQLGVVGSSAGGHLVLRLSQHYNQRAYPEIDDADQQSCEPNFVITGSAAYLCEKGTQKIVEEFPMSGKIAPTFMVCALDDKSHGGGSVVYEKALNAAGGTTGIMVSETGGHGLRDVNWFSLCEEWLKAQGIKINPAK